MADEFTLTTSAGNLTFSLRRARHPDAAAHFGALLSSGYYIGSKFFRVVPGFVVQAGCPVGDGSGGFDHILPALSAPAEPDEYRAGAVGLGVANGGLIGSQFFVFLGDWTHLPAHYPIVADVSDGIATVRRIEARGPRERSDEHAVVIENVS